MTATPSSSPPYVLDTLIAHKSHAKIFHVIDGTHSNNLRRAAVKVATSATGAASVRCEICTLRHISSATTLTPPPQGLPQLHCTWGEKDVDVAMPSFEMTYYAGCTIDALFGEHGCLSPEFSVYVIFRVLLLLRYLHNIAGVAHRDLKASNLIVNHEGSVALVDFGSAVVLDGPVADPSPLCCGTPHMKAPEQWGQPEGQPYDPRAADMWALGILFVEMLTGRPPFGLHDDADVIRNRVVSPSALNSALDADGGRLRAFLEQRCPVGVADVVSRCLAHDPKDRPTATDLVEGDPLFAALRSLISAEDNDALRSRGAKLAERYAEEMEMQCLGLYFSDALRW
eukprot:PhM_4_TR15372/c0_g1_i1/m.38604